MMDSILILNFPLKFSKPRFLKMHKNSTNKSSDLESSAFSGEEESSFEMIISVPEE